MSKVTVEQINKYWTKNINEYARKQAVELAKEAAEIARREMINGPKTGQRDKFSYTYKGAVYGAKYYKRSNYGEVIGREPSWVKSRSRIGEPSSYNSITSNVSSFVQSSKRSSYNIKLSDTSPRAKYKSEYFANGSRPKDYMDGRDSSGYLRNGRSFLGYGLYNAVENWKKKKPFTANTIKNVLLK